MNKILKWILTPLFILTILYFAYRVFIYVSLQSIFNTTTYTKTDLVNNYNSKQSEILDLKNYFESIVPAAKEVSIEFENNDLFIYHVKNENGLRDSNWSLNLNSKKVDSLNASLGWNQKTLDHLKNKLDKAKCISIENGNPTTIGFQRSGMGIYSYKIFNKKLNDSLIHKYNDGCQYIFFKDNVVLEYGGGAIGPQCFEDFVYK